MKTPGRGDLVYVNFNLQSGHKKSGTRPLIVLSPENFNQATGFAVVCPITRQEKGYPFEVVLPQGLAIEGVILTDQVKNLDWRARQVNIKGTAPQEVVIDCLDLIHTFL